MKYTLAVGILALTLAGCTLKEKWGCHFESAFGFDELRLMAICPRASLVFMWGASDYGQFVYGSWRVGKDRDSWYASYQDPRYEPQDCLKHYYPNSYHC